MIAPLLFVLATNPSGIVGADLPVSMELVCRVQRAIRWKAPPMPEETCLAIAEVCMQTPVPRLLFAMAINESDLRPRATARTSTVVSDRGLLGIRCVLNDDGVCSVGPARGYTPEQLLDPKINIRVGFDILRAKRFNLRAYNGGTVERGYRGRIEALMRALEGRIVETPSKRIRGLARQIVNVVTTNPPTS